MEITASGLHALYRHWLGRQHLHRDLGRLGLRGWIRESSSPGSTERILHLTEEGRLAAQGGRDPVARWARPWDGRWRVVLFDVPETRKALRQQLRRKLRLLGFGYLQDSAWITPDAVEPIRSALGRAEVNVETLTMLEARPAAGETDAELVRGTWNFDAINHAYRQHGAVLDARPRRTSPPGAWRAWLDAEQRAWQRALDLDPLLPNPLLPAGYRGRDAWQHRCETFHQALMSSLPRCSAAAV